VPADSMDIATQAWQSFEQGRFSDAEKLYEQILAIHPDNVYALSNLAVVQFRTNELRLAEANLNRAITVAPNDVFLYCTLGVVYYQERKFEAALRVLSKALALDPGNVSVKSLAMMVKGRAPPEWGDFDTQHERALRQAPGFPAPRGEIGLSPSDF